MKQMTHFNISKEQQLKELTERIPPVLNIDLVVVNDKMEYLIGKRNAEYKHYDKSLYRHEWMFPGGRMKWDETIEECIQRKLSEELPGITAKTKRLITAISGKGADHRAHGVSLYYLLEYESGIPKSNEQFVEFSWVTKDAFLDLPRAFWLDTTVVDEIDISIRSMHSSEEEMLVEVDDNDHEVGVIGKRDAHNTEDRAHRSAMMLIFNSKGEVILHQRSPLKSRYANYWDAFGGHNAAGMTIEQTAYAELSEELGITTELEFIDKYHYKKEKQSEFQYWYAGTSDGPYGYDKNEVAQIKAFEFDYVFTEEFAKEYQIIPHTLMMLELFKSKLEKYFKFTS